MIEGAIPEGMDELSADLAEAARRCRESQFPAWLQAGQLLSEGARKRAPVLSGALRSTIRAVPRPDRVRLQAGNSRKGPAGVPYARVIQYGPHVGLGVRDASKAHPFMDPTRAELDQVDDILLDFVAEPLTEGGL